MFKISFYFFLSAWVLFLSACSQKSSHLHAQESNITVMTQGDFELQALATELETKLQTNVLATLPNMETNTTLDEVTLIQNPHVLFLILNGQIFRKNSSLPIHNAVHIIENIASSLVHYPHIVVQVTGHTDRNENALDPQDLSDIRAIAIAETLYNANARNDTFAKGCAHKKPLFTESLDRDNYPNARIEIYFYSDKDKMQDRCSY